MKSTGRFGPFGGTYVPEILVPALEQLEQAFLDSQTDPDFQRDLEDLLTHYAGRPTPLYRCRNLARDTGVRIYLKREDLVHGGAHKTNQVLGQGLLARRMGKKRIIAETGAGQHGVAAAMVGALYGIPTRIYMGARDIARQQLNVFRMRLMGAEVVSVESGSQTLKDAINEAMRDWAGSYETTHYMLGTVAGPHPFPTMVRDFQRIIGDEARRQVLGAEKRLPDVVLACVGGGSNAIGMFTSFVPEPDVALLGVEPAGKGTAPGEHGMTLEMGRTGILHGAQTTLLQDEDGQVMETHSLAAGLDYPGVGPEHAWLQQSGRATYVGVTDTEALDAFRDLARQEGIVTALESAHALAYALKIADRMKQGDVELWPGRPAEERDEPLLLLVNLSGRGDKDMDQVRQLMNLG